MLPVNMIANSSKNTKTDFCRYLWFNKFTNNNTATPTKPPFQYLIDAAIAKIHQEQDAAAEAAVLDLSLPKKRLRSEDGQPISLVVRRNSASSSPLIFSNHQESSPSPTISVGSSPVPSDVSGSSSNGSPSSLLTAAYDETTGAGYRCPECNKVLPTRVGLKRHIFYHTKPFINSDSCPYRCDVCPAAFSYRTSLEYHRVSHFLDGKERLADGSYQCDKCQRVFDGLKMLKRHKMKRMSNGEETCSSASPANPAQSSSPSNNSNAMMDDSSSLVTTISSLNSSP